MGENILPCNKCGVSFRDSDLIGEKNEELICFDCRKREIIIEKNEHKEKIKTILSINSSLNHKIFDNFYEVIIKIKNLIGRDNEINPDIYGEMFFEIMLLSDVSDNDKKRYFSYSLKEAERCLNKYIAEIKDGR